MKSGTNPGATNWAGTNLDRLLSKLAAGGPAIGTVVNLTDPTVSEVLASAGYDFIWIDMEHTSLSKRDVSHHILAARSQGAAPLVRIAANDPALAKPILEMGPAGIVFPFVNTGEEAERAVRACRYPPGGIRGFGPQRANSFGSEPLADYMNRSEQEPWVVVQIEHVSAIDHLDDICAVPGLGSLLVGPFDLSASVGKAGQIDDPEVAQMCDAIAATARKHGTTFGAFTLSGNRPSIQAWLRRGASWLALDTDLGQLRSSAFSAIRAVKESAL